MADKQCARRPAGSRRQGTDGRPSPDAIRNVVLVGHSGAGKTTLVEALLVATGTITRAGRVEDGTTVSDFDEAEHRQQRSVGAVPRPARARRRSRSTCSTPPATPTSSATCGPACAPPTPRCSSSRAVDGVDGATRLLWEECAAVGMPRAVVVTKLDHQRADFDETVAVCQRRLRRRRAAALPAAARRRRQRRPG